MGFLINLSISTFRVQGILRECVHMHTQTYVQVVICPSQL